MGCPCKANQTKSAQSQQKEKIKPLVSVPPKKVSNDKKFYR